MIEYLASLLDIPRDVLYFTLRRLSADPQPEFICAVWPVVSSPVSAAGRRAIGAPREDHMARPGGSVQAPGTAAWIAG